MKPVIYQLFIRLFGNKTQTYKIYGTKEENGCGKFEDINVFALNSLKTFGISHVWYTGVIEHAVAADYSKYGIDNDYPEVIKGRAGSPYAIKDYYDVNPDLAIDVPNRMIEFEDLIKRTHCAGLKVIIDFVPNHLARVYRSDIKPDLNIEDFGLSDNTENSFSVNNDFYYIPGKELKLPEEVHKTSSITEYRKYPARYQEFPAKVTGNNCFNASPQIGDWYETVKLNYGVDYMKGGNLCQYSTPPVWEKMKSIILYWAEKKVDGFRVDMAEMVPVEFWEWLIPSVKQKYPELLFIAEVYQPGLYRNFIEKGRFDYLYDKVDFYDTVRKVIEKKSDTTAITLCWQRIGDIEKFMLRFLENHDEQRLASRYFAGDPWKAIPGIVLAGTMNTGPLLLYFGQEVGESAEGISGFSGDDGRTTIFDYWAVPNHQKWMSNGEFSGKMLSSGQSELRKNYSLILKMINDHEVFCKGSFYDLMWVNDDINRQSFRSIYAYLRYYNEDIVLIIINFGDEKYSGLKLYIPEDAFRAIQINEELKVVNSMVFPDGTRSSVAEKAIIKDHFIFDITSLSALVLFMKKR